MRWLKFQNTPKCKERSVSTMRCTESSRSNGIERYNDLKCISTREKVGKIEKLKTIVPVRTNKAVYLHDAVMTLVY